MEMINSANESVTELVDQGALEPSLVLVALNAVIMTIETNMYMYMYILNIYSLHQYCGNLRELYGIRRIWSKYRKNNNMHRRDRRGRHCSCLKKILCE